MHFLISCGLLVAGLLVPPPAAAAQEMQLPHLRELAGNLSQDAVSRSLEHAVEEGMVLPPGHPATLEQAVLVNLEVSPAGQVENACIVAADKGVSAVAITALLAAVRQLPVLVPGRQGGQPVRAALTLAIRPGVAAAAAEARVAAEADSTEARTRRRGLAELRPAEAIADFLGRVLPVSFPAADKPISYAWHPSAYGLQLFFSAPGGDGPGEQYERNLFILDPIGPATYAVQVFNVQQADYTTLEALFFADANHDGQKDLLALTQCDLREYVKIDGQLMPGRFPHYQTTVIYYRELDGAGRPRYEEQYRADLDELATAAEVRQALAAPPRRPKSAPRRNPASKAAK